MNTKSVILNPLVTEKTTGLQERKVYGFEVSKDANKNQVQTQIEKMFQVKVDQVRMIVRKGKMKRVGRRMVSKQMPSRKIAYVTVKKGEINVFPKA